MTTKKKIFNISALAILAVFAAGCAIGFTACGSGDDMTDDDAAALYAALEKTCGYSGSFTVVNTDSGSSSETEKEDGKSYTEKKEYTDKYSISYDADTGYLAYVNDETRTTTEDGTKTSNTYSEYYYYVPEDGALTLYSYSYDSSTDSSGTKTKTSTSSSNSLYTRCSTLSHNITLSDYYGGSAWTTVKEAERYLIDADEGTIEVKKKSGETIYTATSKESWDFNMSGSTSSEDWTLVIEIHVNSDGYVTKYSVTETDEESSAYGSDSWSETDKTTDEYEISYSFDSKLKLSEKDMADYE